MFTFFGEYFASDVADVVAVVLKLGRGVNSMRAVIADDVVSAKKTKGSRA